MNAFRLKIMIEDNPEDESIDCEVFRNDALPECGDHFEAMMEAFDKTWEGLKEKVRQELKTKMGEKW